MNMKRLFAVIILILVFQQCYAQLGVNEDNSSPDASSMIDIKSGNKGILIPRVALTGIADATTISSPATSLLIYNTATVSDVTPGFYFWTGSTWSRLMNGTLSGWGLSGNTGTTNGTDFIGTTDNQNLDFRTDNVIRARITSKGQIEILNTGNSVFLGEGAGASDDLTDNKNIAIGKSSLNLNTKGNHCIAIGIEALSKQSYSTNEFQAANIAIGYKALLNTNTTITSDGINNTGIGFNCLMSNTNGSNNLGIGSYSLVYQTSASDNIAFGYQSMLGVVNQSTGGQNIAIGSQTLKGIKSGTRNIAIGPYSLSLLTIGINNIAIGVGAINKSTSGNNNIAIGDSALFTSTTGFTNIAIGNKALFSGTTTRCNIAIGDSALFSNVADTNIAIGHFALFKNTTGRENIAIGGSAMANNTQNKYNIAIGQNALYMQAFTNTMATFNVAIGYNSLYNNNPTSPTTGLRNIGVGAFSLLSNTTGVDNIAIGYLSLKSNTACSGNIAIGSNALMNQSYNTSTSTFNIAIGYGALAINNPTNGANGRYNIGVGYNALSGNTTGYNSTGVGYNALSGNSTGYNITGIGYNASINNALENCIAIAGNGNLPITASNTARIGNSVMTSIGGQVPWTTVSDKRIKDNVKENVPGLNFILQLKPVTYTYNIETENSIMGFQDTSLTSYNSRQTSSQIVRSGFLAQDVDFIAKSIDYNFDGVDKPDNDNSLWGLRYATFTVPLVKAVQEQQELIISQQQEIDTLKTQIESLQERMNLLLILINNK